MHTVYIGAKAVSMSGDSFVFTAVQRQYEGGIRAGLSRPGGGRYAHSRQANAPMVLRSKPVRFIGTFRTVVSQFAVAALLERRTAVVDRRYKNQIETLPLKETAWQRCADSLYCDCGVEQSGSSLGS